LTSAEWGKWFGEVDSDSASPCLDMGNGKLGDDRAGTVVSYLSVIRVHDYGRGPQLDWSPPTQMQDQETDPAR
jgi:hypothetical protein